MERSNKERISALEEMVKDVVGKLDSLLALQTKADAPVAPSPPTIVNHQVGFREITTTEALQGPKAAPLPTGPIPVDKNGNICDPSWQLSRDGREMHKIVDGQIVERYPSKLFEENKKKHRRFLEDRGRADRVAQFAARAKAQQESEQARLKTTA